MQIPTAIDHPAITEAAERHARMVRERDATRAELRQAEHTRPHAVDQDQQAYARALENGKKDPGEKHTEAADEAIRQARRKAEALDRAVRDAQDAVAQAVATHRDDVRATLANRLTDTDRAFSEAVDRWEAAASARADVLSAVQWLERGDFTRPAPRVGGFVPGLSIRPRGGGYPAAGLADVARAMRELVNPPDDPQRQHVKVGGSMAEFLGVQADEDE